MISGPSTWCSHYPDGRGKHQSPIDLREEDVKFDEKLLNNPLIMHHDPSQAQQLINNGLQIQLTYNSQGSGWKHIF